MKKNGIPFVNERAKLDIFKSDDVLVPAGLNAQFDYEYPHDFHVWSTRYGYEHHAETSDSGNKHRRALSDWLMQTHGVAPDTCVILECLEFLGDGSQ